MADDDHSRDEAFLDGRAVARPLLDRGGVRDGRAASALPATSGASARHLGGPWTRVAELPVMPSAVLLAAHRHGQGPVVGLSRRGRTEMISAF